MTTSSNSPSLSVQKLCKSFGQRKAVNSVSFQVQSKEIFGLLGPNGGGKTTLFRILATLIQPDSGEIHLQGMDLIASPNLVRNTLGVVFQAPSLDKKLKVVENLRHQGNLYGMKGKPLENEIAARLAHLGVDNRANDLVETLSGGLQRRVEIAKALLHSPKVLLLDEPSTGLDPGARADLWQLLNQLRTEHDVTILLTTHLMEEAERCDRIGIMHQGEIIALDTPTAFRSSIGGDVLSIQTQHPDDLSLALEAHFGIPTHRFGHEVRLETNNGTFILSEIQKHFPEKIESITLGKPTLEDVFIRLTGHRLAEPSSANA